MNELQINMNEKIDRLEYALVNNFEPIKTKLKHTFLPGLYIRGILMPRGIDGAENVITSLVHNTYHPFVVLSGKVSVYSENDGVEHITAPYEGVTQPGTRRVLVIHEDTYWVTYHPTNIFPKSDSEEDIEDAVKRIGNQILQPYENHLLGGHLVNNKFEPEQFFFVN